VGNVEQNTYNECYETAILEFDNLPTIFPFFNFFVSTKKIIFLFFFASLVFCSCTFNIVIIVWEKNQTHKKKLGHEGIEFVTI